MKVSKLIEELAKCNPDANLEIRGTVEEGYLDTSDISVDNCDHELVVLDI